ncbi:alpha/beta fold hydrolase [Agromyces sp. MMS24-K17]|uniref:alpha/beta fold hydrolase n=1 Tax=Agromyces sp. MMS24-K17 TaxID=3372850 RepID=UPI003754C892
MSALLLHGLGSDRRQPLELFSPALAAEGHADRILALDVRAHGDSPLVGDPDDFALDRLAAEVAAQAVAELGDDPGPLTVIGISMGAAIALRLALDDLLPVTRAVFARPSFTDEPMPENLRAFPVIGQLLHEAGPIGAEEFRATALYADVERESPTGAQALLAQFAAPDAERRAIRLVEVPRNRAFTDDAELAGLGRRGIRSLVIGARRDPVHPLPIAERWAAGLGATLEVAPARDDGRAAQARAIREALGRWLVGAGAL